MSIGAAYQVRVVDLANEALYADSSYFAIGDPVETYLPIVVNKY